MKKMLKTIILPALLAMSILLTGCAITDEDNWVPAGMKLASTDDVDYKLYVPEAWTVDVSTGIVSAYVSSTDRSNITVTAFNLEGEDITLTPQEYWARFEQQLLNTFPDMAYVNPAEIGAAEEDDTLVAETSAEAEEETEPVTDVAQLDKKNNPVTTVLSGNQSAAKYYYTATVTGNACQFMQVVCIRGGIVYLFTYSSSPNNFADHIEEVDNILAFFQFDA